MALVKDKIVTVESLSALHEYTREYNQETFMTKLNPVGSGTMDFDGDINIDGNQTISGDIDISRNASVSGDLNVDGNITIKNVNSALYSINPETGMPSSMVHMNPYGNTVIGYDGYINKNANSYICGKDVEHHIASAGNVRYRPYYKVGDTIPVNVRTSGYVTQMGTNVFFTIHLTKPIIGEPILEIRSDKGFILRQGGKYTHGSDGSTTPATYVHPMRYSIDNNFNNGIVVIAEFENTTNAINNDSIGIYLDANIILLDPNETQ